MKLLTHILFLVVLISLPVCVSAQTGVISVPDTRITMDETLVLPVYLNLDGDTVSSLSINFTYDDTHFTFLDDERDATISDTVLTAVNTQNGSIYISLASVHPITEDGIVIYLTFQPIAEATSAFVLDAYRLDERERVYPGTEFELSTEPENTSPFIVEIPDTVRFTSGDTLSFNYEGMFSDLEDQLADLTIEMSIEPEGIEYSFDLVNHQISIISPEYVGEAVISMTITDSDGAILEFSIILVVDISVSKEVEVALPVEVELQQNYPNPFNPSTNISYTLSNNSFVTLKVYDMTGREIETLISGFQAIGAHQVTFNANGLASGFYWYRIITNQATVTRKMMLIK